MVRGPQAVEAEVVGEAPDAEELVPRRALGERFESEAEGVDGGQGWAPRGGQRPPVIISRKPSRVKPGRLAVVDDAALALLDLPRRFGKLAGRLDGDVGNAVLVAVEEVAGLHDEPAHLDGNADVDQVMVGVGDEDAGGEGVEGHVLHLGEVAHAAVW